MRILIVEDDPDLREALATAFGLVHIRCDLAHDAADAEHLIATTNYTIVVLDLGLPDEDGLALLRRLRTKGETVPIVILTARGDYATRVAGLRSGADDFLVKPFLFDELHARIDAVIRRQGGYIERALTFGRLSLDATTKEASVDGVLMKLTVREIEILEPLMRRAGHVVPKRLLEDQLFGAGDTLDSNAIEVYIHRLRRKLQLARSGLKIETVVGVGYHLGQS